MSEKDKKTEIRDYTKPIMINFKGREGHEAYIKMVTTPPRNIMRKLRQKKLLRIYENRAFHYDRPLRLCISYFGH